MYIERLPGNNSNCFKSM